MDPFEFLILGKIKEIRGLSYISRSNLDIQRELCPIEFRLLKTLDFLRDAESRKKNTNEQVKALVVDVVCQVENAFKMVPSIEQEGNWPMASPHAIGQYSPHKNLLHCSSEEEKRPWARHLRTEARVSAAKRLRNYVWAASTSKSDVGRKMKELEAGFQLQLRLPGILGVPPGISEVAQAKFKQKKNIEKLKESLGDRNFQRWRRVICSEEVGKMSGSKGLFSAEVDLVQQLITGDTCRQVVSIVARGGAGKTTLADRIYRLDEVKNYFSDAVAWIYVNDNVEELLQDIAEQVMGMPREDSAEMNMYQLLHTLSEFLKERRYLIVLDDMQMGVWDHLQAAFPDANNGSRIMLTTREMGIAKNANTNPVNPPYELPPLTIQESWNLFLQKAFPWTVGEITRSEHLEEIGKQIVAKCQGLPLAIEVIGGLVTARAEGNVAKSKHVMCSLNNQLSQESMDFTDILSLCCYDLPFYLRPYFLYLALFPKGRKIDVEKLIMLWVAESFTQQGEEQIKEDVVKDYFLELVGRNMIQVIERKLDGEIVTCRMHGLLHDLLWQSQFSILDLQGSSFTSYYNCRLAIHNEIDAGSLIEYFPEGLLSILCLTPSVGNFTFLTGLNCVLLRVLDLEGVQVPEYILDLVIRQHVHLKYLNLRGTSIKNLPISIGKLYSLETLLLDDGTCLPETIWKLHQLRHLHAFDCAFEGQPQLQDLKNLYTLCLSADDWIEEESLRSLTGLRILKVAGDVSSHLKVLWSFIEKLISLQSLLLSESLVLSDSFAARDQILPSLVDHLYLYEMVLAITLERLPKPHEFPPNLTRLVLDGSRLDEDPMPTLEKLKNLQILQLSCNAYQGKEMISSAGGFPQLVSLTFLCFDELEEWMVEAGAMPKLSHLSISVCPNLNMLPEGLRYITTLKEFQIWDIPTKLYDRLQKSRGEDWCKIQHIPYLRIRQ